VSNAGVVGARWRWLRVAQWATLAALVAMSEAVAWAGHSGASYAVDGLAVVAYLGFRRLRRSPAQRG
jgi:hypothetical protein